MSDNHSLNEEFRSAEALHRFEVSLMLGQTAVYLVATGSLVTALANSAKNGFKFYTIAISVLGIILSVAFYVITHRCGLNQGGALKRARELGASMGFMLYSAEYRAPQSRFFRGKTVTKAICIVGGIFWSLIVLWTLLH